MEIGERNVVVVSHRLCFLYLKDFASLQRVQCFLQRFLLRHINGLSSSTVLIPLLLLLSLC